MALHLMKRLRTKETPDEMARPSAAPCASLTQKPIAVLVTQRLIAVGFIMILPYHDVRIRFTILHVVAIVRSIKST